MGRPRQVVNYHVRELARAGFLRTRRPRSEKRGLVEQRYVVSAQAYLLAPEMLGAWTPRATAASRQDQRRVPADARAGELQRELSESWRKAEAAGAPLPLLSLDTEFGFASASPSARASPRR